MLRFPDPNESRPPLEKGVPFVLLTELNFVRLHAITAYIKQGQTSVKLPNPTPAELYKGFEALFNEIKRVCRYKFIQSPDHTKLWTEIFKNVEPRLRLADHEISKRLRFNAKKLDGRLQNQPSEQDNKQKALEYKFGTE